MKNAIILVCLLFSAFAGFSQVGIGTKNPDTTSVLDLSSTTKGLLIPRMTTVQRNAIISPAMGLQVLNVDDMCLDIYDGRQWIKNCGMKEGDPLQGASRSSISDSIWTKDGDRIFPADPARIGIGTEMPDSSALLDIVSTSQGFLMPRMTTAQRDLIESPAAGLQILNTDDYCLDIFDGTYWIKNCGFKVTGNALINENWTQKKNFPFNSDRPFGFSIGSLGYMGGGYENRGFFAYNPATDSWSQKANYEGLTLNDVVTMTINTPTGVHGFMGTGAATTSAVPMSLWKEYNPSNNTWKERAPVPGNGRISAVGFSIGNYGFLGTGKNDSGVLSDFYKYTPADSSWAPIASYPFSRHGATSFVFNGVCYVGLGTGTNSKRIYYYDEGNNNWVRSVDFPKTKYRASSFTIQNIPFILAGTNLQLSECTAEVWRFTGHSWVQEDDFPGGARLNQVGFSIGDKGYLGVGRCSPEIYQDFWEFQFDAIGNVYESTLPLEHTIQDACWTKEDIHIFSNSQCIGIGNNNPNAPLQFKNAADNRKLVLNEVANNDYQFYGLGSGPGLMRYQIAANTASSAHAFFAASNDSTSIELMRIQGNGYVGIGTLIPHAPLQFKNTSTGNRKIVLNESVDNEHEFYGFGTGTNLLRYQVGNNSTAAHVFYAGSATPSSTELMRIQGNGNIGIDNAMPLAPLHFNDAADNRKIILSSVIDNDHQFYGLGSGNGQMRYQIADDTGSVAHVFFGASSSSTSKELMRIQGDGNIGIGTSTPNELLEIGGEGRAFFGNGGGLYRHGLLIDGNEPTYARLESYDYLLNTGRNLVINSIGFGNVGIGTISPRAPLQFKNSYANRKIVLYQNVDNDYQVYGLGVNDNVMRYQVPDTFSSHILYAGTSATTSAELMRIQGNGKVGIGTTTPHAPLQFNNIQGNRKIVLYEWADNDHEFYGFGINTATLRYQVPPSTNHVFFAGTSPSSSVELMRIQSDGKVCIGNTAPNSRLIFKESYSNRKIELYERDDNDHEFYGFGINPGILRYQADVGGSHVFYVGVSSQSSNELMRITKAGNVGVGISNVTNKMDINGNNRTVSGHPVGRPLYVTGSIGESSNGIEFRHDNGTQGIGFGWNTIYATGSLADQNLGLQARGSAGILKFTTGNIERMRIQGNGYVGIGTAVPGFLFELGSNSAAKPGSSSWNVVSDARLKKDIKPFTDGLDLIQKINPVWFRYNGLNGITDTSRFAGIIAQEIQKIAPYMIGTTKSVTREGESYLSYDANSMTYILINAVKEQQIQIQQQQDRIETLEKELKAESTADVADMKAMMAQMQQELQQLKQERK